MNRRAKVRLECGLALAALVVVWQVLGAGGPARKADSSVEAQQQAILQKMGPAKPQQELASPVQPDQYGRRPRPVSRQGKR